MGERPKISAPVPLDTTQFKFHLPRNSELNRGYPPYDNQSPLQYEKDVLPAHGRAHHHGHDADSGRRGFHPIKFLMICFNSSCILSKLLNCLWPVVPVIFVTHNTMKDEHLLNFILSYFAMVPSANLLGFAGRELASKLPLVAGALIEVTFGSIVEFILLLVLVRRGPHNVPVIKAAVLGSILANLLLCLGLCFFAGGLRRNEQRFHRVISETGNGLLLVAAMGLVLPAIFSTANPSQDVCRKILKISRGSSVILLAAYFVYVFFQMRSHHSIYKEVLELDHHQGGDSEKKRKLTATEAVIAVTIAIICVSFMAIYLVDEIEWVVEHRHVKDAFVGLILVPLVEKAAEHVGAIAEAWEDHINSALAHVLGASIQTALLNTPLIVLVGWGLRIPMDLQFVIFDAAVLILAIIVVGNFLRDGKSNYLVGFLCVLVYMIIALSAFYYPNAKEPCEAGHSRVAERVVPAHE